jgi:uncharacterized protein
VFPYSGRQLGLTGPDADRVFQVLRPPEELSAPECIDSFKLIPWIDEHVMLGPKAQEVTDRAVSAEKKGVSGVIGQEVFFKDGTLFANIKAFSSTLAQLIQAGKRELSAGYRCIYDMTAGVWNGQNYDAVQRKIRGNHLALVTEGRMGPDVAVMDRFTFSFDALEIDMADKEKEPSGDAAGAGDMTLAQAVAMLSELAPQVAKLTAAMAGMNKPAEAVEDEPAPKAAEEMAPAMDESLFLKRLAKRDQLAKAISVHVGTFDHAEKTLADVVAYGCDKLGLKPEAGQEEAMLAGYLQAKPQQVPTAKVAVGLDAAAPRVGSFVDQHLGGK